MSPISIPRRIHPLPRAFDPPNFQRPGDLELIENYAERFVVKRFVVKRFVVRRDGYFTEMKSRTWLFWLIFAFVPFSENEVNPRSIHYQPLFSKIRNM